MKKLYSSCNKCGNLVPDNETHIIAIESKYFGVVGNTSIRVCKMCFRDHQLEILEFQPPK